MTQLTGRRRLCQTTAAVTRSLLSVVERVSNFGSGRGGEPTPFEPRRKEEQRHFSIASIIISPRRTPASATAEFFWLSAVVKDVTVDFGELADFSGTTLKTGDSLRCYG